MAVYYKFKSAKDFRTVSIPGPCITLGFLKLRIAETHRLPLLGKRGCEMVFSDPETHEVYMDEETLIPRCASVLICRVPSVRLRPLINAGYEVPKSSVNKAKKVLNCTSDITASSTVTHSSISFESSIQPEELESDDFGPEIYTSIKVSEVRSSNPAQDDVPFPTKAEGCWRRTTKIPPPGYICHRCHISGHFIKDCPTNGDSAYDFGERSLKSKFGPIDASSILASKSNEACYEREKQRLSSCHLAKVTAPELRCPLCKTPIKEAVFASKCSFYSFVSLI